MSKPTDFNDLAQIAGHNAVKATIDKALADVAATSTAAKQPPSEWPDPHLPGMVKAPEIPAAILPG